MATPAPQSGDEPTVPVQPVGPPPPAPPSPAPPPPVPGPGAGPGSSPRRQNRLVVAAVGLVIVVALVVAGVLIAQRGGDAPKKRVSTAPVATPATSTTLDPVAVKAEADYRAYVDRIENILQQSAQGRGQVGPLVAGVENGCRVSPNDASQKIRSVIDNRTSILNQLSGLSGPPNPEAQSFYSLLQQALQSSIEADIQYKGWMDYLYTQFYNAVPVGCPSGNPPRNAAYAAAREADGKASDFKTQFVTAFNPVATRFGLQTWQATDF